MSDETASPRATAMQVHLSLVGLSVILSFIAFQGIGLVPGEVIEFACCFYLVVHAVAAVVGLLFRRVTVVSCLVVFGIAFFPAGMQFVSDILHAYRERYVLPGDRFRDHLGPVPTSVQNLRFVPLKESKRPDLMFRFDIAPADLDDILARLKMVRITRPEEFRRHDDLFKDPSYLPLDGDDDEVYQAFDKWNQLLIIKTNKAHTRAIFREG